MPATVAVGSWSQADLIDDRSVSSETCAYSNLGARRWGKVLNASRVDAAAYVYAFEDLEDLVQESELGSPSSGSNLKYLAASLKRVKELIGRMVGIYPPPEITARDTGTVLLLWRNASGLMSIELGEREFGAVVSVRGSKGIYRNGDATELIDSLPELKRVVQPRHSVLGSRFSDDSILSFTSFVRGQIADRSAV